MQNSGTRIGAGQERPGFLPAFLVGPILYLLVVIPLFLPVSFVLDKAGVPVPILMWSAFLVAALAAVLPGYFVRESGFHAFANHDGAVPGRLLAPICCLAAALAALAVSALAGAPVAAMLGAAAMMLGMILSVAFRQISTRRGHGSGLIRMVERRSGSPLAGAVAAGLVIVPLGAILSGQLVAFASIAGHDLGLPPSQAVAVCIAIALAQIWLPGARGLALGGIAWLAFAAALIAAIGLYPEPAAPPGSLVPFSGLIEWAVPFLPAASLQSLPGDWFWFSVQAATLGAGLALTPLFRTPGAPGEPSWRMALLLLAVSGAVAIAVFLALGSGSAQDHAARLFAAGPVQRGFSLVLMFGFSGLAAICLQGMAMVVATRGREPGSRGDIPSRRLAAARISMLAFAVICGWVAMEFSAHIAAAARISLAIATAALLPVTLVALGGRTMIGGAAPLSMLGGAIMAGVLASQGEIAAGLAGAATGGLVLAAVTLRQRRTG